MENTVEYNNEKILFLNSISNIKKKNDGSFIVDYNSMPYHISKSDEMLEKYNWLSEYVKINPEKCTEYVEPVYEPTKKEKEDMVRMKRDSLIQEADIMLLKYAEQVELGIITANETYRLDLLTYKQALRDIPEQKAFPENVEYPELPKYNNYE